MKVYIVKVADKSSAIEKVKIAYANDVGKELVWNYDKQGKPIGDNCNLSISHTSGVYVLAVSDRELGVDVESQSRHISPKLGNIKLWTQKEAYGKMLGTGLTRDIVESFEGDDRVQTIDLDGQYWLSVCSEDRELKIVRL
ncbi:MAG: 4'-phosphopantetheinyl transferase family protein [Christensenellales bacterium]